MDKRIRTKLHNLRKELAELEEQYNDLEDEFIILENAGDSDEDILAVNDIRDEMSALQIKILELHQEIDKILGKEKNK